MEYSALIQPPSTFCSRIQPGTFFSIVAAHITLVLPNDTSTEPVACGADGGLKGYGA